MPTALYAAAFTVALAFAATQTRGETQRELFIIALCSMCALMLATLINLAGHRAQRRATEDYERNPEE